MVQFPIDVPVLRVSQPMGIFYVAILKAEALLQIARSDGVQAQHALDGSGYTLHGIQRFIQDKRLAQIADYINREDAAFPNSVILAANYDLDIDLDQEEIEYINDENGDIAEGKEKKSLAWRIYESEGGLRLNIPSGAKIAAIIDGQHRIFAYAKADPYRRLQTDMICSIFIDLPKPFQAQLFATINSTQKQVDRSLTYELFGYNVNDEPPIQWPPDKLAVFFTRKLGTDVASPMRGRIIVAPKQDLELQSIAATQSWHVSTAVIVDGILRLFSSNPKRDANAMKSPNGQRRAILEKGPKDSSPLRNEFISGNDQLIYKLVENYLITCEKLFWNKAEKDSFILKTVGVQALFDVLRKIAPQAIAAKDISESYFEAILKKAAEIDFSAIEFRNASGSGRSYIKKSIEKTL